MAKFISKVVEIEAMEFTEENKNRVFNWVGGTRYPDWDGDGKPTLAIETIEGTMRAQIGDWIIKGLRGEFYPCKPDVFALKYQPLEAAEYANAALLKRAEDAEAQAAEERSRLDWWLSDGPKDITGFLEGVKAGRTPQEWRDWIDEARASKGDSAS